MRVRVPGKLNLHLGVGPRRADGYHELYTVFHAVDLSDEIVAARSGGTSISITGSGVTDVPADERNLAWQAAVRLAATIGRPPHVHLSIHKRIPVAGGMAGGSADAAAALVACARLWRADADLAAIAAELGSDTVFPLLGGTAIGTGRGEVLTPVAAGAGDLHWVLAMSAFGISAAAAYRELDRLRATGGAPEPAASPAALLGALREGDVEAVAAGLANDLQAAALSIAPQLRSVLDAGARHGALSGIVSGSGPTCAFLCRDLPGAVELAKRLTHDGLRTVLATGPAPGAQVVP